MTPETQNNRLLGLFALTVFIAGFAAIAVSSSRTVVSYDAFWHLKMGEDLVQLGLSPWRDHYSFTFLGAPIDSPPVLFQIVLHSMVSLFGVQNGFAAAKLLAYCSCLAALILWSRSSMKRWAMLAALVPFLLVLFQLRMLVRPEIFTYLLVVIAFVLYERMRIDFSTKNLLLVSTLVLFWVNYHTPVIPYVIFFGLFVEVAIAKLLGQRKEPSWKLWAGGGAVLVLIGFLKPGMQHFLFQFWHFDPGWAAVIQEYKSAHEILGNLLFFKLFIVFSLALIGWAVHRREVGFLIVCSILLVSAWSMARLVPMAGLAMVCMAIIMSDREDWSSFRLPTKAVAGIGMAAVFAAGAYSAGLMIAAIKLEKDAFRGFPVDVVDYMESANRDGRVFNTFEVGGYLIYRRAPRNSVFIDGRTAILYPIEFFKHYEKIGTHYAYAKQAVSDLSFDYVLATADDTRFQLWSEQGFKLDFLGEQFFLLSRKDAAMQHSGAILMNVWCWDGRPVPSAAAESALLLDQVSSESTARANFEFYAALFGQDSHGALIDSVNADDLRGDVVLRVAAQVAALAGNHAKSMQFLQAIRQIQLGDFLSMALSNTSLGNFDQAELTLMVGLQRNISPLSEKSVDLIASVLHQIEQHRPLRFEQLNQLLQSRPAGLRSDVGRADLCGI